MGKLKQLCANMAFNIIGVTVLVVALFGTVVSATGFVSFTNAFKKEYAVTTYHIADTATTLIEADHLEAYLAREKTDEYLMTRKYLDAYCKKISVSLIYVIVVDQSDYGRFVSVFNSVDNSVDNTSYTPWELGHKRDTTNDEYRQKYKAIYEEGSPYETLYRIKVTDGQHPHITTMVPVQTPSGRVTGILCVQRPIREINDARRPYLRSVAFWTILLAVASSAFAALFIRRQVLTPIRKVSDEATRFARENIQGEPLGEISRFEELASLAGSIDTMESDMTKYIDNLTSVTAERERIGAELALASTIQENSVPNTFPAFPDRTEFDIYAAMDPAKEVGGDFYNFFLVDDDHLAMIIGDVSGKGVPAALFMMVTNILITDRAHMGAGPAEVLRFANQNLCGHNKAEMFVSVWLGILEISTGKLTACNAGHEYPAILHDGGQYTLYKDRHGLVIAALDTSRYTEYELQLSPGDRLFVYTDGVPEATAADNSMFGTERMLAALNEDRTASPEQVLEGVRRAVDSFVKDAEQFDDLTMLCLEYKGNGGKENDD